MGAVRQGLPGICALFAAVLVVGTGTCLAASTAAVSGFSTSSQLIQSAPSSSANAVTGVVGHLCQVLMAPLQIPATIVKTSIEKNVLYGVTIGAVRGVGRSVTDVVQGTWGAVTSVVSSNPVGLLSGAAPGFSVAQ